MLAKLYRGRRQPGSGNLPGKPNDVRSERLLIEAKYTSKKSYVLHHEDLRKLHKNAAKRGIIPVMVVGFDIPADGYFEFDNYVILREEDFVELAGQKLNGKQKRSSRNA